MKRVKVTDNTSASVGFTVKSGTWEFIQDAFFEGFNATMLAIIGSSYDSTKLYRLSGVVDTYSTGVHNVSAGWIFWNGEIYYSPSQTINTVADLTFGVLISPYISGTKYDPVQMKGGGTPINVHNVRTIQYLAAASGNPLFKNYITDIYGFSYISDTLNGKTINFTQNKTLIYSVASSGASSFSLDFTNAVPGVEVIIQTTLSTVSSYGITGASFQYTTLTGLVTSVGKTTFNWRIKYLGFDGTNYWINLDEYGN